MSREARDALLLLLGVVLLRVSADGLFLRYVRPGHRWLLLVSGAVVVTLALVGVVSALRGRAPDDGHRHGRVGWALLLPVLVIGLVAPPALGADAVARDATAPVRGTGLYPPLPDGVLTLALGDVVDRAVWDEAHSVAGRDVVVTGFLARRLGTTVLARMRISCCAADARASALRLSGSVPPVPPDGREVWLRVRGRVVPGSGTPGDGYVPELTVTRIAPVPAPPDRYEY